VDRATHRTPFVFGAAWLLACGAGRGEPVELCTGVLERKLPASEVLGIVPRPLDRPEITYAAPGEDGDPVRGRLACEVERSRSGGLRLRAAILDGRPLSETELVVLNAELLLDDLDRIGRQKG
jgi:hypothetical protein